MSLIEPGQIWENKHLLNHEYDVIVRWANDSFVWSHYLDEDDLCKESRSDFLNIRKLKLTISSPSLNENQQVVLEWLKSTWIDRKKKCWFPFEVINSLYYQFDVAWGKVSYEEFKRIEKDKPYIKAYGELTALEQFEVLKVFSEWALEQEEE